MKRRFPSFLSGLLAGALLVGAAISALAISGHMTIEVDPINIQVNGATFQPTDVNGNEVPVFAYNGTTYAPLRALAEAYGLEVGYDAMTNMATVSEPKAVQTTPIETSQITYEAFKGLWTDVTGMESARYRQYVYAGTKNQAEVLNLLQGLDAKTLSAWTWTMMEEFCAQQQLDILGADLYFYYGDAILDNLLFESYCMGGLGHNGYGDISWGS